MGTTWSAEFYAPAALDVPSLRAALENQLASINAQMSHWREDSDLSRFNRAAPGEWVQLPAPLLHVLHAALAVSAETAGAFDATLGRAADAWGFGPSQRRSSEPSPPSSVAPLQIRGGHVLQPGGVSLDFSAIAKGYAVDQLARIVDEAGVASYLVEIGGELRARGIKPDAQPWWIAIERPPADPDFPDLRIALCGMSAATSGDYRRYFESGGLRYPHTLDPRTQAPIRHAIASVTVLHPEAMLADAYSTALAVMGPVAGIAFADAHDLAAVFILRARTGFRIEASRLFREMLAQ